MIENIRAYLDGIKNNEDTATLLKYALNAVSTLALYLTILFVVGLVVWAIVVRNRDEEYLEKTRRTMFLVIMCYVELIILSLGSLRFVREIIKGGITIHFGIVAGLLLLLFLGMVIISTVHDFGSKAYKLTKLGFLVAVFAFVVVLLIIVQPMTEDFGDGNVYTYSAQQPVLMYILSAVLVAVIAVAAVVGEKAIEFDTKSLTYAAICIACSFALSYIKFFSMPQGGSVTFASLLPLALYSYMFGTRKGVIAAVIYGLLQFMQSPQPYQMMQILLDYPIAFGAIGVAGLGRRLKFLKGNVYAEFAVGTTIAALLRYVAHVFSGYFVFYAWAGDQAPLAYSLAYNSFVFVDLVIVLVMGVLVLSSKTLRKLIVTADPSRA